MGRHDTDHHRDMSFPTGDDFTIVPPDDSETARGEYVVQFTGSDAATPGPPAPGSSTPLPASPSPPRPLRNRPEIQQSDPHERLPYNPNMQEQHTHRLGQGQGSGRNLLALFGNDNVPRTRYPLQVERGRRARYHHPGYPEAQAIIPAGLSLGEICRLYPNHVWGSLLRIYMAEGWGGRRIWRYLPLNARVNTGNRPWNNIQQAIGRELDKMVEEDAGVKRVIIKRGGSGPGPNPKSSPSPPSPPQVDETGLSLDQLQQISRLEVSRQEGILQEIIQIRHPSLNNDQLLGRARHEWRNTLDLWSREFRNALAEDSGGQENMTQDVIALIREAWQFRNVPQEYGTLQIYEARATWEAWRLYLATIQTWTKRWEQARTQELATWPRQNWMQSDNSNSPGLVPWTMTGKCKVAEKRKRT
ncbi:uncharacterized protein Z518_06088 [Rhinocladiella mackenziei CBS 650.93]|uniref:Uncharacterized protein n=1 Tax=Rhinocladiella mackenziei CBS 650.93 TaxID=1442369 RepID=A0A0D2IPV2_9EURO|nr:uncharacterized protein Z518_06088 [Rhinocladiella mackenziei CBS 650.93]KIX05216.1 hypothetical protein Z518_06088 [Rhinocladiella mackenziei CBS 650.93]